MIENYQKAKQLITGIFLDIDLFNRPKDVLKAIVNFLQIDQSKVSQKNILAEKIIQIYELCKGQYDQYLTQPKFRSFNSQAKDLLWTIFKQFDQRSNQRKYTNLPKQILTRQHMPHVIAPSNQNMNMNMVNMYLDVPSFHTVEEVQVFQRKMFQIYKSFIPQVLSSMSAGSSQPQYYRSNPYQPYHMGSMGSMGNMGNMNSMSSIGSLGSMPLSGTTGMAMGMGMGNLGSLAGMNSMSGIAGMTGVAGMPGLSNINGLSGMTGMPNPNNFNGNPNYSTKTPQFYDHSNSFPNRYFYQNKGMGGYSQSHVPKTNFNDFRTANQSPFQNVGFNFCGQRNNSQENKAIFKGGVIYPQVRINNPQQQYEKKISSQKNYQQQARYDSYQSQSLQEYPAALSQKQASIRQKQKQSLNSSQIFPNQLPRKMVKKDDQVSIFNEEPQPDNTSQTHIQKIACTCNQKNPQNICYYCRIINLDPLNQVQQTLKMQVINVNQSEKSQFQFIIPKKVLQRINKNPQKLDIELRCIKIEKQQYQMLWPQKYRLSIDQQILEDFMQSKNSKKRKDKPFVFSKHFGNEKNTQQNAKIQFQIKKSEKAQKSNFLFGVFIITKNTIDKMYQKIMKKIKQQNISQFFKKQENSKEQNSQNLQKIIVSPFQPSIKKLIKDPVRGKSCTHPQCFDLQVFLSFLIISPNRQWKCPICFKQAKEFVIDNDQKNLLSNISKMIKQPNQIIFYSNGAHTLKYQQQQQQQLDRHYRKQEKDSQKDQIIQSKQNKNQDKEQKQTL